MLFRSPVRAVLDEVVRRDVPLVLGDNPNGLDAMALRLARQAGLDPDVHEADWDRYGLAAGPKRNGEMVRAGLRFDHPVLVAFPDEKSKGTRDCVRQATATKRFVVIDAGRAGPRSVGMAVAEALDRPVRLSLF